MPRRLPLLLTLIGIAGLVAAAVLLLAPLPPGGAEGSALAPRYPDVVLTGGLRELSDEQYEQVYGTRNAIGERRRGATAAAVAGAVLLLVAPVLRRASSR